MAWETMMQSCTIGDSKPTAVNQQTDKQKVESGNTMCPASVPRAMIPRRRPVSITEPTHPRGLGE